MTMPVQIETIVLRRTFDAPVERVYRAWTEIAEISNWWTCGEGLPGTILELDVRVGGKMRVSFGIPGRSPPSTPASIWRWSRTAGWCSP